MSECLFCKIIKGEIPSQKIFEDEDIVAFYDINPQSPVHILVVPKVHKATLDDLEDSDAHLVGKVTLTAIRLAKENQIAQNGYRLVWNCREQAGQTVFHIHLHLLGGRTFEWPPG